MSKAVEKFSIWCEGEKIADVTSYEVTPSDYVDNDDYPIAIQGSFTMTVETMFFNDTWFLAYMGRMYANQFTN